jgi:hypothetical protein
MTDHRLFTVERVIEFEARIYVHAGARQEAIRRDFRCSVTRYTQALYALLDAREKDMRAIDPITTRRLIERRHRDSQARERLAGRPTIEEKM